VLSESILEMRELALAKWTGKIKRSALQDMLVKASGPDVLSLALGLPAAELFPKEECLASLAHVLATEPRALQYQPPLQSLKRHVVALMAQRGVKCLEEQVFLTAGAQQGLSLLTRLLLDTGAQVLTEELTYTGFQQALQPYEPQLLTVPTNLETGMDVDAVERLLSEGARPSLIYSVTDGHNPLGVSMSLAKRQRLVEVARQYCVPIIEDDPYGFLCYEPEMLPPLRAFDEEWVFYVGTFSKLLAPAFRAGWIIVRESLIPHLAIIKEASDIDMSTLSHRAINAYLDAGHLPAHLEQLRKEYGRRRDAMLQALENHFPGEALWHKPDSGFFVWVELPERLDAGRILEVAIESERVAFIPGQAFCATEETYAHNCLRLNFSNNSVERIEDGVSRLARVLKEELSSCS
jgi:2-aminoadipate transaminase